MPANNPHLPVYSLKDLILVGAFVKFVLGMTAAVLMRHHNGTVDNTVWAIGVAVIVQGFLGSVADWVDSKKRDTWLHDILQEREDPEAVTDKRRNTSSVQTFSTGPVNAVANVNGQDGQEEIDKNGVIVTNPLATTNTNSPTSTLILSTYGSASILGSEKLFLPSQTENSEERDRNYTSAQISEGDGIELEMQQLTLVPIPGNMTINITPLTADAASSKFLPALGASLLAEAKGTDAKPIAIYPATNVGMDTPGNQPSLAEETRLASPCIVTDTAVISGE